MTANAIAKLFDFMHIPAPFSMMISFIFRFSLFYSFKRRIESNGELLLMLFFFLSLYLFIDLTKIGVRPAACVCVWVCTLYMCISMEYTMYTGIEYLAADIF